MLAQYRDFTFPNTETVRRLYRAWERFRVYGEIDSTVVKPHVQESWIRSASSGAKFNQRAPLQKTDVFQRNVDGQKHFLKLCRPVVEQLSDYFAGTKVVIILSDEKATILKTWGDPGILEEAQDAHIMPRGVFTENAVGTNALPLAAITKQPVLVTQTEHFSETLHVWSCYSVPVIHPVTGLISGILDISSTCNIFHPQNLTAVSMTGRALEQRLGYEAELDRMELILAFQKKVASFFPWPVIALDRFHRIVAANQEFFQDYCSTSVSCLPIPLSEVPDLATILRDIPFVEQEQYVTLQRGRTVRLMSIPCYRRDQPIGWLVVLASMDRSGGTRGAGDHHADKEPLVTFERLVGSGSRFAKALELAKRVSRSTANVLLLGETGTGKEMFAQAIHHDSPRRKGPFVPVNCGAIPRELIASELFGYEEGAFSGARKGGKKGYFELAQEGTLFLDEIGELPLDLQAYLLRVLQTSRITRLGGTTEIALDVRIIAATNIDLFKAANENRFRKDLLYRLSVVSIHLPALRERGRGDLEALIKAFLDRFNRMEGKNVRLDEEVREVLLSYVWPGNVRELENVIHQLVVVAESGRAQMEDLPVYLRTREEVTAQRIEDVEKRLISEALIKHQGNFSKVAKELGIARGTLYRKVAKYGL
ncbi:sigma-54-dependent Fis family transcriptional regulator [Kyrpidia tusciae]|uniref:Sigma54 specific transcriptional regulator, Fis family n=1 Tax=Kyrpidia tusciae (strain DSM 2912 / NBRC 15312 / T2) TaxID=562970 RepID=D5WXV0_KYRT2|nr:sigma-54-dependent Fis family transcriptional regulator [Kyrpidia tusciae]ADG06009.1 sigma54 specific transcriptional regulator, Fis family [Kyrpidia tusciae DSM 2912]